MSKKYFITGCQNATNIDDKWWKTIQHILEFHNAELLIIPIKYKHTSKKNQWYDSRAKPFIVNESILLGKHLMIQPVVVTPTNKNPLPSLATYCKTNSACFGFPRLTLQSMVTTGLKARVLFTTGACTVSNYADRKAGNEAAHNHQLAGQLVEIDDNGYFHRREIEFLEGVAYDLRTKFTHNGVRKNKGDIVVNPGDWHFKRQSLRKDGGYRKCIKELIEELEVDYILAHDFLDFRVQNHHSRDGKLRRIDLANKPDKVSTELEGACDELAELGHLVNKGVLVVESNHDDAYDRWLEDTSNFDNPLDAEFYHESWLLRIREKDRNRSMFDLYYHSLYEKSKQVKFIGIDSNFHINNTYIHHGHIGPSGSRGSPTSFVKLAKRSNSGHTHSPYRNFGVTVAGVTELEHGYNKKIGGWDQALNIIHENGSVQILHFVNKRINTN